MNPKIPIKVGQIRKINSTLFYLILSKAKSSTEKDPAWNVTCIEKHLMGERNVVYSWSEKSLINDEVFSGSR